MRETRGLVERVLERGDAVYGMTTGVGARKKVAVPAEEARAFNRALIVNHRVGQGPDAPEEIVRATMVRLANALASGDARRPARDRRAPRRRPQRGRAPARADARVARPGRPPADGRPRDGLFADVDARRRRRRSRSSTRTPSPPAWRRWPSRTPSACSDAMDVAGALDLEAFAANLTMLHPAIAAGAAVSGPRGVAGAPARAARRELALGAGRRAEPPGPALLPRPAAAARRAARRARVRSPASSRSSSTRRRRTRSSSRTRIASSRSRTSRSCRSRRRSTSCGSRSPRR